MMGGTHDESTRKIIKGVNSIITHSSKILHDSINGNLIWRALYSLVNLEQTTLVRKTFPSLIKRCDATWDGDTDRCHLTRSIAVANNSDSLNGNKWSALGSLTSLLQGVYVRWKIASARSLTTCLMMFTWLSLQGFFSRLSCKLCVVVLVKSSTSLSCWIYLKPSWSSVPPFKIYFGIRPHLPSSTGTETGYLKFIRQCSSL